MTCTDYKRWLSPYLDAILAGPERSQLEAHLTGCAGCRGELDALRHMLESLRAMEQPAAPNLLPGIHRQLQREPWWQTLAQRFIAPWPASLPLHGVALAATALLVVFVVSLPGVGRQGKMGRISMRLASSPQSYEPYYAQSNYSRRESTHMVGEQFHRESDALQSRPVEQWQEAASMLGEKKGNERQLQLESHRVAFEPAADMNMLDKDANQNKQSALKTAPALQRTVGDLPYTNAGLSSAFGASNVPAGFATAPASAKVGLVASVTESTLASAAAPAQATSEMTAYAKTDQSAQSSYTRPDMVQVEWRVQDLAAAATQAIEWIGAHHGAAITTNEHHLSIALPAAEVLQFLAQFSTQPASAPALSGAPWVAISLELSLSK